MKWSSLGINWLCSISNQPFNKEYHVAHSWQELLEMSDPTGRGFYWELKRFCDAKSARCLPGHCAQPTSDEKRLCQELSYSTYIITSQNECLTFNTFTGEASGKQLLCEICLNIKTLLCWTLSVSNACLRIILKKGNQGAVILKKYSSNTLAKCFIKSCSFKIIKQIYCSY